MNINIFYINNDRKFHRYKMGVDALEDTLLMSKLNYLICSGDTFEEAANITVEEVDGEKGMVRTTQDMRDIIDTGKKVQFYSSSIDKWLRHKSNQYIYFAFLDSSL